MNLDGVYEGECTSGDEEVGCDWGEVVVCTIEGELGGLECGGEGFGERIMSAGFGMIVGVL